MCINQTGVFTYSLFHSENMEILLRPLCEVRIDEPIHNVNGIVNIELIAVFDVLTSDLAVAGEGF